MALIVGRIQGLSCRGAGNLASVASETFVAAEPSSRSSSSCSTGASTPDVEHSAVAGERFSCLVLAWTSSSQKVAKRILQSVPSLQLHSAAAGLDGDSTMARERLLGRCLAIVRVRVGAPEKWLRCALDRLPGSGEVGQARPREDSSPRSRDTRRPGVGNCWSFVKGQNFRRDKCQICQSFPLPTQAT